MLGGSLISSPGVLGRGCKCSGSRERLANEAAKDRTRDTEFCHFDLRDSTSKTSQKKSLRFVRQTFSFFDFDLHLNGFLIYCF